MAVQRQESNVKKSIIQVQIIQSVMIHDFSSYHSVLANTRKGM